MIDRKKYDVYNKYNTDNKHAGEVMHYNKDSEKLYISLFYPKTESEKLNTIINDYYKEYLDNQKASKNSKDILYMDYSIDKVFDQYLNLSFTAQRYNEDNEKKDTETKRFAYDLNKEKVLNVNDCLRRSYKRTLSNINGIDKIEPEHTDLKIGKKALTIYSEGKEKIEISRKTYVELSKNIEQNTDGFLLIKSYNQQEKQIEKFKNINSKMYKADYEIGVAKNNISRIINILYGVCFMIGFTVGIQYIVDGIMTVGELTAFIGYISNTLSNFVAGTQKLLERMPYMKQSLNRFNYFLNLDEYKKDGKSLEKINTIEVKHLSYWYDNTEKPALDNINMTIHNGDKIGIIGQVGSGKTTLMNIISGFYEIPEGMVLINGEDIGKYKKDDLFSKYNYALQQNVILDDTIKANVDITENLKKNEFKKIIKNAELEEDIEKLDKKEDTLVGEKGVKLSGGQKQRVSIARNLSNARDINIFDDTLSALDSNTEKKIMNNLLKEVGDNTVIVISNKISSVEKLNKIYVLLDGKIEDCGTHEELLERNEFYKEVYMLEKKEEEDEIYTKEEY